MVVLLERDYCFLILGIAFTVVYVSFSVSEVWDVPSAWTVILDITAILLAHSNASLVLLVSVISKVQSLIWSLSVP